MTTPPIGPLPRTPPRAGDMRRFLAAGLDCYLCLLTVGLLARSHAHAATGPQLAGLILGPALAFSFLNQVVLTALVGAGAGKLIMGIRVIGLPDAGRPGLGRLTRRWLHGMARLPLQPCYWLRPLLSGFSGTGEGPRPAGSTPPGRPRADPSADLSGLRQVRRSDLAAYRSACETLYGTAGAGQRQRR
ncbi:RDD family protein [Streptomyces sp. NPDC059460]|uniref:RDD family protein n=1 Tax=Streptomyces sp. NPDC059460 TaxID=3346840 RepID=UPI0036B0CA0E